MEALLVPIVIVGFVGFISYLNTLYQNKIKQAWQAFAEVQNWGYSDAPTISGTYEQHHLYMDSFYANKITYTRIRLTNPTKQDSPAAITPLAARKLVAGLMSATISGIHNQQRLKLSLATRSITYAHPRFGQNVAELKRYFQPLIDYLEKYIAVGNLGAAAIPLLLPYAERENEFLQALSSDPLGGVATQLINDIGQATQRLNYLAPRLLCPDCLVRLQDQTVKLSLLKRVHYCACRYCQQSHTYLQSDQVVAVLDADMVKMYEEPQGKIRVNWLERRSLFDFDAVRIIQATDEDVERFAVQVGNDTDAYRVERYGTMQCMVSSEVELSVNTMRILRKTFGEVLVGGHSDR